MGDHWDIMAELCADRGNRILKRDVAKLSIEGVLRELYERQLSRDGDETCLRDRLLRSLIKDNPLMHDFVPWYETDVEAFADGHAVSQQPAAVHRSSRVIPIPRQRGDATTPGGSPVNLEVNQEQRQRADSARSGDSSRGPRQQMVFVQVHQPPPAIPIS